MRKVTRGPHPSQRLLSDRFRTALSSHESSPLGTVGRQPEVVGPRHDNAEPIGRSSRYTIVNRSQESGAHIGAGALALGLLLVLLVILL